MSVITVPTVSIQLTSASNPNPVTVISIGGLSFTAATLFYDPQFAINALSAASPNNIPFYLDPQVQPNNAAPVAYIRNLDPSAVITLMVGTAAPGGTVAPSAFACIGPGGFFFMFNQKGAVASTTLTPSSVGVGAVNNSIATFASTFNVFITSGQIGGKVVYAEVLIAG